MYKDFLGHVKEVWSAPPNKEVFVQLGLSESAFHGFDWGTVDTQKFHPHKNPVNFVDDQSKTVIGTFRRIRGEKLKSSYETFLRAAGNLAEVREDFHIVIGGYYEDDKKMYDFIDEKIEKNSLSEFTTKLDMVPKEEMPRYYSGLDIYVNPPHLDVLTGIGTASKEAMACGCPLISLDYDGLPRKYALDHGEEGYLVHYDDSETLTKIFSKLCGQDKEVSKMGERARERVMNSFSEANVSKKVKSRCKQIIKQHED